MNDKQQKTKMTLVEDLESIKASLSTEDISENLQYIPILQDAIIDAPPIHAVEEVAEENPFAKEQQTERFLLEEVEIPTSHQPQVLPGQQSLFDNETQSSDGNINSSQSSATQKPTIDTPKAKGENPFLPKHIRERLKSTNSQLVEAIAQTTDSLLPRQSSSTPALNSQANTESIESESTSSSVLVDQLVEEYLPKIEAELRKRLQLSLNLKK